MTINTNNAATLWNSPNYVGELYQIGSNNKTPFLNMLGGLSGGQARIAADWEFPLGQVWDLEAASQPAITETASLTAPNPWTYVRSPITNTCQIFQAQISLSYAKQSAIGRVTADATTGVIDVKEKTMNVTELDFQINAAMKQMARNIDYTFLNGVYQQATNAGVAAKTRGVITAVATNTVNANSAALSRALLNQLLRTMAGSGATFDNPVIFVNAFQKQAISALYSYAPMDRNVGGVNISSIETDFAIMGVVFAPAVPAGILLIADMNHISPVFLPVPKKGVLFYEDLSKTGAAEKGQIYGQIGLDYGPEQMHGTITGLATS